MIPIRGRSRAGFGTTTTFVLVTTGIALMILVFANLQSSGTRISIERAYTTGHLLRVGKMALNEAFRSKEGQEALTKAMLSVLTKVRSQMPALSSFPAAADTPENKDLYLQKFVDAVLVRQNNQPVPDENLFVRCPPQTNPDDPRRQMVFMPFDTPPGQQPTPIPGAWWFQTNGKVVFAGDQPDFVAEYKPKVVEAAYGEEVKKGTLKFDKVEMRVVAFKHTGNVGTGNLILGKGIVRGRAKVSWVLPREYEGKSMMISRTMYEEWMFLLERDNTLAQGMTPQPADWKLIMTSEYHREAIDE